MGGNLAPVFVGIEEPGIRRSDRLLNRMAGQLATDTAKFIYVFLAFFHPIPTLVLIALIEPGLKHFAFVVFCSIA